MFKGSMVALVTPMRDGLVDVDALKKLVNFHIKQGTHALVAAGTTGESATLSDDEKALVIKTVVDEACERLPVIAGTAAVSTSHTIELTQMAMELGADGALIMTPPYIKPTQAGLIKHYQAIASNVALPLILYNVPSRTAVDLLPESVQELAKISNVVGIKEATGDMQRVGAIKDLCGEMIDVYSGDDISCLSLMERGGRGVISVTANVAPKQMALLCDLALDGEFEQAGSLQETLMPLHEIMFIESNPIPVKSALHCMGLIEDDIRLPLTSLTSTNVESLKRLLSQYE